MACDGHIKIKRYRRSYNAAAVIVAVILHDTRLPCRSPIGYGLWANGAGENVVTELYRQSAYAMPVGGPVALVD